MPKTYPCKGCTRVKDPENCENKRCQAWQEWFLERWAAMQKNCSHALQEMKQKEINQ